MNRRTFLLALATVPLAPVLNPRLQRVLPASVRTIPKRYLYARIRLTWEELEACRHKPPQFAQVMRAEHERAMRDVIAEFDRAFSV